jgi:hypothetical protein
MKRLNLKPYVALLVLAVLLSACSESAENSGSSNTSVPPAQANNNSAPASQSAEVNPPSVDSNSTPLAEQPIPQPPAPADKPSVAREAKAAKPSVAANARGPKLVVTAKTIDYGKQPQDKSLVRAILIKNGGLADLSIESVVPS